MKAGGFTHSFLAAKKRKQGGGIFLWSNELSGHTPGRLLLTKTVLPRGIRRRFCNPYYAKAYSEILSVFPYKTFYVNP